MCSSLLSWNPCYIEWQDKLNRIPKHALCQSNMYFSKSTPVIKFVPVILVKSLYNFTKTDNLKMIIHVEYFVSLGKSQLSFCCHCLVAGPPLTNLSLPWIISRKKAILPTFFLTAWRITHILSLVLHKKIDILCSSALKAGFFHVSRNKSDKIFLFFQFKTQPPTE